MFKKNYESKNWIINDNSLPIVGSFLWNKEAIAVPKLLFTETKKNPILQVGYLSTAWGLLHFVEGVLRVRYSSGKSK